MSMSLEEILNLKIGTRVLYTCGNITEERTIGNVLCKFSAISDYGTYMPLNKETYQEYGYKIELIPMTISIEIPKEFESDYKKDKFEDFFSRVLCDIEKTEGLCGNYEKETVEMFLQAFRKSKKIK